MLTNYLPKMQLLLCVLILGLVVMSSAAQIGEKSHPRVPPRESLKFGISLLGVPAGTATMDTTPLMLPNGLSAIQFNSRAISNAFISFFFTVNNVVNSTVDAETMLPLHLFFQRREGKRHEDFDITFNHQSQLVTILKDGQTSTMAIPKYTHDGLSCLFYLRQMPNLDPGQSVFVTIHHDKNNYEVEVQVEAVEQVEGPWGEIEAVRLVALMPFSGIFLNEGNIRFWLTNDVRRVPLKMSARVIVGSVEAVLENWPL